jgi:hypothetical protein
MTALRLLMEMIDPMDRRPFKQAGHGVHEEKWIGTRFRSCRDG